MKLQLPDGVRRGIWTMPTFVSALVSALCFSGCGGNPVSSKEHPSNLPVVQVRTKTIENNSREVTEEIVGTVRAKTQATLEAKVNGRIDRFPVVLGQRVKAGELVARLDAAEIKARLDQAEAALEQAERDWKRHSALFEKQAATRAEYEATQTRYHMARGVAAEARAMMSYVEVLAPFDGVVTKKWADSGDLAAPGIPLISIEDASALQLEADVPQGIASHVRLDARFAARVDSLSGELTGTVSEIAPAADPVTRTFRIKLDLPNQPGLQSGQFARLFVPVGEYDSLRVPETAIVQRGQLEMVFVVSNRTAQLHLVKTGKRINDEAEILSGLRAGDAVVVGGAAQLTDGQPVEVK